MFLKNLIVFRFHPFSIRHQANASHYVPVSGIPNCQVTTTVLPNGLVVASAENRSSISRISIQFNAGARNEDVDSLGTTHVLRIAAGLSTKHMSRFAFLRNMQQIGSNLSCSTDREIISYNLESTRENLDQSLPYLTAVATEQCFNHWELSDNIGRLRLELESCSPRMLSVDLLHKAAYRSNGLGNSLYISKYKLENITGEDLQNYLKKFCTAPRTAVVGLGVDHEFLIKYAFGLPLVSTKDPVCNYQHKYKGGEIRSDKGSNFAHVAIAGRGASLKNAKETLSFAILQKALGGGTSIKHTAENRGLFAKVLEKAAPGSSVMAINISYTDSGLFGALISAPTADAGAVVADTAAILRNAGLQEQAFLRAKKQLKLSVLTELENGSKAIEDMGMQAGLIRSEVANGCQIATAIDTIQSKDVEAVLSKISSSKFSIGCIGNLRCVPYLDELL